MRKIIFSLVLLSAVLAACTGTGSGSRGTAPIEVAAWTGEMPISQPWLREHLPAGVLTYERIPHPLGLLAMPKGNALDIALGSEANIRNLIGIQQGLAQNLGTNLPPVRLLERLHSPIEIAVVGLPLPSALIGATLSLRSNAEFEAFLAELGQFIPVSLAGPLDGDGYGQLVGTPLPILVHFDAVTGRMALYGGMFADRTTLASILDAPADTTQPMHALEAQIDASGQGFFAWIDAARALQLGAGFMPPEVSQTLNGVGVNQVRALAIGSGVADGKGRLKLLADVGSGNAGRPLPVVSNAVTAMSVGELRSLFLLSLPSRAEFSRLESLVTANLPPDAANGWTEAKAAVAEATGTSIEEVLSALGPELIMFSDRAGDVFGLHVRDQALLESVLDRWSTAVGVPIESRQVGGGTVRYWELPGTVMSAQMRQEAPPAVAGILGRLRNRLYWVEDGDYLYLAGTPQVLIDRINMGADTSVADWLAETQRIDVSSSLLAVTGTTERLPRMMYNAYLGIMQGLADIAGAEYDVFAMPTATQLGLPERGAVGATLNLGEPYVSFELSYESHPFEVLFGGGSGMAAVAGIGIAAAIALPAYQDYTIRAEVSEGLNLAAAPKAAVVASWTGTREAPADRTAAGMTPAATDTAGRYVESIDVVGGEVVIRYGSQARPQIAMATLTLTPYATAEGSVVWKCGYAAPPAGAEAIGAVSTGGTTIAPKYLPSVCR